jgi:3-hydroxy-3-methylglutaryl CoA synthase
VVGVDIIPAYRGEEEEAESGAGAAAVAPRPDAPDPAATLDGIEPVTTGFVERHRCHDSPPVSDDERFEAVHGFGDLLSEDVADAVSEVDPDDGIVASPVRRIVRTALGLLPEDVDHHSTYNAVGYAGAASFLLDLVDAIERSNESGQLVGINYGPGGADVLRANVPDNTAKSPGTTVAEYVDQKEYVTYAKHLEYREQRSYDSVSL